MSGDRLPSCPFRLEAAPMTATTLAAMPRASATVRDDIATRTMTITTSPRTRGALDGSGKQWATLMVALLESGVLPPSAVRSEAGADAAVVANRVTQELAVPHPWPSTHPTRQFAIVNASIGALGWGLSWGYELPPQALHCNAEQVTLARSARSRRPTGTVDAFYADEGL